MGKFYIISYDISKESKIRDSVNKFFTKDISVNLSQTSFLVYSDFEYINNYFKEIEMTLDDTFSILEISDPISIKLTNIYVNPEIQKFIEDHKPKQIMTSSYNSFTQFRS